MLLAVAIFGFAAGDASFPHDGIARAGWPGCLGALGIKSGSLPGNQVISLTAMTARFVGQSHHRSRAKAVAARVRQQPEVARLRAFDLPQYNEATMHAPDNLFPYSVCGAAG